jgi:hypothetical protein
LRMSRQNIIFNLSLEDAIDVVRYIPMTLG